VIIKQQYGKLEQKAKKLEPVLQKKTSKNIRCLFSEKFLSRRSHLPKFGGTR
jgi:hypothetical protein